MNVDLSLNGLKEQRKTTVSLIKKLTLDIIELEKKQLKLHDDYHHKGKRFELSDIKRISANIKIKESEKSIYEMDLKEIDLQINEMINTP